LCNKRAVHQRERRAGWRPEKVYIDGLEVRFSVELKPLLEVFDLGFEILGHEKPSFQSCNCPLREQ
jgi:hypothetical protein